MGLFDKLFNKQATTDRAIEGYFKALNAYTPVFTNFAGGLYEMELTRAAIHGFANLASKFKPEIQGNAYKSLGKSLQFQPNPYMDATKFIYRIATILEVDTTAFIVPLYGADQMTITGFYPVLPSRVEIIQVAGEPWLRYTFGNGETAAIEFSRVGIMTKFQYKNDFWGDGNGALFATLNVLDVQRQGILEGIKQAAVLRFMAKLGQTLRPEDITRERNRFSAENLSADNTSGVMMFDAKYSEVKQIDSKPFIADDKQMEMIKNNVFNYFGTNEQILQNKYTEEEFNAYYEGKLEPFALQLSLVLSNMTYTPKEMAYGNQILFTSNRMQYASNNTKLQVSSQLFDRGILTTNQIMDIWNMPHVADGDKRYIRKEYAEVSKLDGGDDDASEGDQRIPGSASPDDDPEPGEANQ